MRRMCLIILGACLLLGMTQGKAGAEESLPGLFVKKVRECAFTIDPTCMLRAPVEQSIDTRVAQVPVEDVSTAGAVQLVPPKSLAPAPSKKRPMRRMVVTKSIGADLVSPAMKRFNALMAGDERAIKATTGIFAMIDRDDEWLWGKLLVVGAGSFKPAMRHVEAMYHGLRWLRETERYWNMVDLQPYAIAFRPCIGPFMAMLYAMHESSLSGKIKVAAMAAYQPLQKMIELPNDGYDHGERLIWLEEHGGLPKRTAPVLYRELYKNGNYEEAVKVAREHALGERLEKLAASGIQPRSETNRRLQRPLPSTPSPEEERARDHEDVIKLLPF